MKTSLVIVGMMMIAGMAMGQDPCSGVTCPPGMGPYTKEICFFDQNNRQRTINVCYCLDAGLTPALSIQKIWIDAGEWQLYPMDVSEMTYWAAIQIYSEYVLQFCENSYPCRAVPVPPPAMEYENADCWNIIYMTWAQPGHEPITFAFLTPCGERTCTYLLEGGCYYNAEVGKCCAGATRTSTTIWIECNDPGCEVKGCDDINYGNGLGRLCNPICVE
jgi:hypothetical protein